MTDALKKMMAQSIGARFYRADLHIHSFGASHDVRDTTMTVANILATAVQEKLSLISITDHNEISNVELAIKASAGTDVLVIPGIELSTPQGHLLCYLPTFAGLQRLFGQLSIVDRGLQTSRCQQSIFECLNLTQALGGFGILAHVDAPSGYEMEVQGASPHKFDVICHPGLLGIELKVGTSTISYGENDPVADRARMGRERIRRLSLGSKQFLARVLNSDAHAISALGRNASNDRKVTRYKMERPSFEGLRVSLEDCDARVRIEEQIPPTVPRIVGFEFEGGFLTRQIVQFSPNLNCIIGGRGTGKSTAFEAVRCLTKEPSDSGLVDSEVWPDQISLGWQDKSGQLHTLIRPKDSELENLDDPDFGPTDFDIDCFGQGEAAKIGQEARTNPLALLSYLDKFIDLDEALAYEAQVREQLLVLQTEIEKSEQKVSLIPQYERLLATTRQQLKALQKPEVRELIELQRQLSGEREVRNQILTKIQEAKESLDRGAGLSSIEEIRELAEASELSVGGKEFGTILAGASAFERVVEGAQGKISAELSKFEQLVGREIAAWKTKEMEAQKRVDAARRELEALKVIFDMSYIAKLAKDEASHDQAVKNLKAWQPHLKEQRRLRGIALKERWSARHKVAALRDAFGRKASMVLKEALSDLQVSLKYAQNAYSPDATAQIIQVMGWRTNQQPRANWLVGHLTVPGLLDAIQRQDTGPILQIETPEGVSVFDRDEAETIIQRLGEPSVKYALERATLYDLPRLNVSREIVDENGRTRFLVRDFTKLSLGQQQSVLLALMLSSDSDRPLIIDQPEDNLDGEFIYSTLVPVLRRAKERRQVVIVTHNPNVAVLGDAEQIIVMKGHE
jgi:energy-coupling factor transporter ATP-binding protein EcfA2/histidinol phosphatase-like PHP family hydrolase